MQERTYYGLPLELRHPLSPLQVRLLRHVVLRRGRVITLDELLDHLVVSNDRRRTRHPATAIKLVFDEVAELNEDLVQAGPLGPIGGHGYRLTAKAVTLSEESM